MIDPEYYKNREQTYIKHYVLKNYLERVAYNIFSFQKHFAYVDGFSGPWKSENEKYEDTSFKIAIDQLNSVKQGIYERTQKTVQFRCMFIEKHSKPYAELESAVARISETRIETIKGEFEDLINEINGFIGNSFSLVFIDPTGWQGFPIQKIGNYPVDVPYTRKYEIWSTGQRLFAPIAGRLGFPTTWRGLR